MTSVTEMQQHVWSSKLGFHHCTSTSTATNQETEKQRPLTWCFYGFPPQIQTKLFLHYIIITTACHPSNTTANNRQHRKWSFYPLSNFIRSWNNMPSHRHCRHQPPCCCFKSPPPGENQEADCGRKKNALHSLRLGMPCCQNAQNKKKHPSVGYPYGPTDLWGGSQ